MGMGREIDQFLFPLSDGYLTKLSFPGEGSLIVVKRHMDKGRGRGGWVTWIKEGGGVVGLH